MMLPAFVCCVRVGGWVRGEGEKRMMMMWFVVVVCFLGKNNSRVDVVFFRDL